MFPCQLWWPEQAVRGPQGPTRLLEAILSPVHTGKGGYDLGQEASVCIKMISADPQGLTSRLPWASTVLDPNFREKMLD